jgi:transcriptional regulator with XRE-family HTH domain
VPDSGHRDADLPVLGQAVRRIRKQRGISIDEMAGATGLSRRRIEALEAGRLNPTYGLLLMVANGLGVQPSDLIAVAEQIEGSKER